MTDLVSVIAGPILGGVFGWLGKEQDRKNKKLEFEFEEKKFIHETEMRAQERIAKQEENEQNMAMNSLMTESDIAKTIVAGEYAGLEASIDADSKLTGASYRWVDAVRAMIRPGLTVSFSLLVGILAFTETGDIKASVIASVLTNLSIMIPWYFGSRPQTQFKTKWQK